MMAFVLPPIIVTLVLSPRLSFPADVEANVSTGASYLGTIEWEQKHLAYHASAHSAHM
jgi:hypothetical protein